MIDWLKNHWEFFAGAFSSFLSTIVGCWLLLANKIQRLHQVERVIFGDEKGEQGIQKRLRDLEDANIGIKKDLDNLPQIAASTKKNGDLLQRIAGKLEID